MKKLMLLFLIFTSCAAPQKVTMPDGREYVAVVNTGTIASIKLSEHEEVTFDRRGKPSIFEDLLKLYAVDRLNKD